jgi:ethanolamine utilization protein EutN
MIIAKVIGNVWSTKKNERINALRLLFVQPLDKNMDPVGEVVVAGDEIGAGFDEIVLITQGTPAMEAFEDGKKVPVDAVVMGIVDNLEMAAGSGKVKK